MRDPNAGPPDHEQQLTRADLDDMTPAEIDNARAQGRCNALLRGEDPTPTRSTPDGSEASSGAYSPGTGYDDLSPDGQAKVAQAAVDAERLAAERGIPLDDAFDEVFDAQQTAPRVAQGVRAAPDQNTQLTRADLRGMSSDQILAADAAGRLDYLKRGA